MVKNDPSEQQIHNSIVAYLHRALPAGAIFHHSPNEGNRGGRVGALDGYRRKRAGVCAGWPDLEIIAGGRAYFIEIKSRRGTLSAAQRATLARLEAAGAETCLARSIDDVERFLRHCGLDGNLPAMIEIEHRGIVT